ncbi:arsenic resistance protein [Bordetella holmesii]|uniref:Sodium Bile acid symporter family protein n=1 Tax=Bordetella holmesii CDC-H585-BH TaxID=1331206 RepID=A0A158MA33_9BORD|nr:membrane protein [Bordetella holmesii]AHV92954.1 sodium Bile acid symporter family protein [Bordetella holmesii ATCC 51541]EWM48822.1 sodium Bile acid symporter family protein [Bordetella holmesii 41130]AMD44281.1 arsenic resistance protein [Bordetella holmesii H558]AOB36390.1 arsenic resistance protein [Bordetella holmesii]AUL20358.1 arsenic resistance protein [Bordetella holmesii]
MISRERLEAKQVPIYFGAVVLALLAAWALPGTSRLSGAIDPIVALMLFATFLQVPMVELRHALRDLRFLGVLGLANFVAVPLLVAGLVPWMPADPLIRSAMLMVLLAPCIDYVVTFAHLGRADARALLAATPLLLGAQMVLLPVYLSVFIGAQAAPLLPWEPFLSAFFRLIVAPLVLAALCQAWMARAGSHPKVRRALGVLPVPATAVALAVVVAAISPGVGLDVIRAAAPVYLAFAVLAPALGWMVAYHLPRPQRRAVAFSAATRNSLVVLPIGLAIPGAQPLVPAFILTQTLVELAAELVYVRVAAGRQRA